MACPSMLAEVPGATLRRACGRFPSGVTVVTRRAADLSYSGLTVSSFVSISLTPPLVLVSIRSSSAFLAEFTIGGSYAVNVLGESQSEISTRFAQATDDRFRFGDWTEGTSGAPVLRDAVVVLECRLVRSIEIADHVLLIGMVVNCIEKDGEALVHYRSGYSRVHIDAAVL